MQFRRCKPAGRVAALLVSMLPAAVALVAAVSLLSPARAQTSRALLLAPGFAASTKHADKSLVTLGEEMTYTVLVSNSGGEKAALVTAVDMLPEGVLADVGGISADAGEVTATASTVTWTGGLFAATGALITIPVVVDSCEPELVNTVVISDPALSAAFTITHSTREGFERPAMLPPGWGQMVVVSPHAGTLPGWTQTALGKNPAIMPRSGDGMIRFNAFEVVSGGAARLFTRRLDFPAGYEPRLSFWMYHDAGFPASADSLQLQISLDDGATFTSVGPAILRYSAAQGWRQHIVSLADYAGQSGIRLGFLGLSRFGNDIYVDDIALLMPPQHVSVTVQPSLVRAVGLPVTFTASVNPAAERWQRRWSFGDGMSRQGGAIVTHTYASSGQFTATLRLCGVDVYSQPLTVLPEPAIALLSSGDHLLGSRVWLTATPIVGSLPVTYLWNPGDGLFTQTSSHLFSHTYSVAGVYSPVVTLTNGQQSISATTVVRVLPVADVSVTLSPAAGDSGAYVGIPYTVVARIENRGPSPVISASLRANATPAAAMGAGAGGPGQCQPAVGQLNCHAIAVSAGSAVSISVLVTPVAVAIHTLSVELLPSEHDFTPDDHEAQITIPVQLRHVFVPRALNRFPYVPDVPALHAIPNAPDYDGSYQVSWSSVPGPATYVLQEAASAAFTQPITVYSGGNTFYTAIGRPAGTYYYRVKATSNFGDLGWSNTQSVEVKLPGAPVLNPISPPPPGLDSYWVTWSPGARATVYQLQESTNDLFVSDTVTHTLSETSWQAAGKAPGIYYYRVRSLNSVGVSAWSPARFVMVYASPYNGLWNGVTSQSRPFQFEVSGGRLVNIRFGYLVAGCSGEVAHTPNPPPALEGNAFSVSRVESSREYVVTGTFSSPMAAAGRILLTLYQPACNQQVILNWSAEKSAP